MKVVTIEFYGLHIKDTIFSTVLTITNNIVTIICMIYIYIYTPTYTLYIYNVYIGGAGAGMAGGAESAGHVPRRVALGQVHNIIVIIIIVVRDCLRATAYVCVCARAHVRVRACVRACARARARVCK